MFKIYLFPFYGDNFRWKFAINQEFMVKFPTFDTIRLGIIYIALMHVHILFFLIMDFTMLTYFPESLISPH